MSLYPQADALRAARVELDDQLDGKVVFQFSPLQGLVDGANKVFQIPQTRVVAASLKVYKNRTLLATPADYTFTDPQTGLITFVGAPLPPDLITVTFAYTWFTDSELDRHMNRAANELGFPTYHTGAKTVSGSETTGELADLPDGLKGALMLLGAARAASALALRFARKYDISSGDHSYSPSQMAEKYESLAEHLREEGLKARDAHYQGAGRQYQSAIASQGYVLPTYTPKR